MISLSNFSPVLVLLAARSVLALPELLAERAATTCGPSYLTTQYIETITVESFISVPHSCYSYTVETARHGTACPTLTCGPIPECIILSITTLKVPPSDPCCPTTPTVTSTGACPSCQTGCAIDRQTVTMTTTAAAEVLEKKQVATATASATVSTTATPCTTTFFEGVSFIHGPTKTDYPYTATETVLKDCGGCELDVRAIGGLGPVVIYTTTVKGAQPTTMTAFACSTSA